MKKKSRNSAQFWNTEYKQSEHLALSLNPSEDLEKFTRWLIRREGKSLLNVTSSVLDLGCGNGRNLIWLAETFGVHGVGFDISGEAIKQAKQETESRALQLTYQVRSINEPLPIPDESQNIVLDMMVSHVLRETERASLVKEITRVLKPGGYLFYKTFLLDEDQHAARMLKEHPADEKQTYVHPHIGVAEHVSTESDIEHEYQEYFDIIKVSKSHRHKGKHGKRRNISVYMQKY